MKALIRLRGCIGWSGPSLSVYARDTFSHDAANFTNYDCVKTLFAPVFYHLHINHSKAILISIQNICFWGQIRKTSIHMVEKSAYLQVYPCICHMGHSMWKRVFGHMHRAKAQISLSTHAVASGSSLSTNRIIAYYRMYESRAKAHISLSTYAVRSGSSLSANRVTGYYRIYEWRLLHKKQCRMLLTAVH